MKTKIVTILVFTLLIATVNPVAGTINEIKSVKNISITDNENTHANTQPPFVFIVNPKDGTVFEQPDVLLFGYAEDSPTSGIIYIEYLHVWDSGDTGNYITLAPPETYHEFEWNLELRAGENHITVNAINIFDQYSYDEVTVYYNPSDTHHPKVVITSPEDGTITTEPLIDIIGYALDDTGITEWGYRHVFQSGEEVEIHPVDPPGTYIQTEIIELELSSGFNMITIFANDSAGNQGFATVNITECVEKPKMTDNSGNTTFYGLFIGVDADDLHGPEDGAKAMDSTLDESNGDRFKGWKDENKMLLTGDDATKENIQDALNDFKNKVQPGDEFVFYISGHGGQEYFQDTDDNEFDGYDNHITVNDGKIKDDILTQWFSGFKVSVTITIILDCCYGLGMTDGDKDVKFAKNDQGEEYGWSHLTLITPGLRVTHSRPYEWTDKNNDSIVTPDELGCLLRRSFIDVNHNGKIDEGENWWWWCDKNGDNKYSPDEQVDKDKAKYYMDLTKEVIEGLASSNEFFKTNLDDTTNADRDNDGKTMSKEIFEYAVNNLHEDLTQDNDNDGSFDEDGYDFEETNGNEQFLFIDNDGDEMIDEDPGFPEPFFWPNEKPEKPVKPTGTTSGKAGEQYTYTTSTTDPEGDDVYYMFDWGDGDFSDWLGPYASDESVSSSYTWSQQGDYQIRVKARDRCYLESEWADPLEISMPKIKSINEFNPWLLRLIQQFPIL